MGDIVALQVYLAFLLILRSQRELRNRLHLVGEKPIVTGHPAKAAVFRPRIFFRSQGKMASAVPAPVPIHGTAPVDSAWMACPATPHAATTILMIVWHAETIAVRHLTEPAVCFWLE